MFCPLCDFMCWTAGVVAFVLILGWWMNGHFKRRGIKSPPAYLPLVGNMMGAIKQKEHLTDFLNRVYSQFPLEKYCGFTMFNQPVLFLRDTELIKQVTIKEFDHFVDRGGAALDENADPLFGNSLLSLKGQKWRDMRATLSPAFTSSKMKGMFQFIVDCGEKMSNYYTSEMEKPTNKVRGLVEIEMKEAFTRYSNDVIATTVFGLEVNSFVEKDNSFFMMGCDATNFSGVRFMKAFFLGICPRLCKILGIQFFSKKITNFFRSLVWDTVKEREEHNIVRNDMIQLLMEARKGTLKHDLNVDEKAFSTVEESDVGKQTVKRVWTDDEIVAQAMLFFIGGFDTSSGLLCFMAHELALHPNVQKNLREEIDEVNANLGGKVSYAELQNMKYLDMVVSEALRKWPPLPVIDRKCVKSFTFPPPNDESTNEYEITIDQNIWIPVYAIHRDSNFYKNPDVFDPERFSEENKHNIKAGSYLPFGIGPRNCIGSRFALMSAKALMYNLLLKFEIVSTAKTQDPIKMNPKTFGMLAVNGFWVGLKPRQ